MNEYHKKYLELENKYDLINKQINNVFFWKLIRINLFYKILIKNSVMGKSHTTAYNTLLSKILDVPKIYFNQQLYGTIKRKTKKDLFIFENNRKKKINNEHRCLYTSFITKYFKNYELIEKTYLKKHYQKPSSIRSYNDHFSFYDFFIHRIISFKYKKNDIELIKNLEKELYNNFSIKFNLKNMIKTYINIFKYEFEYYNKLLKKRKPKRVILVVSYNGFEPLIAACKSNNIEVIEIQHGFMSEYHLGYSFSNIKKVPYFPDKIWMFGKYWFDSTPLPLNKKDIKYIGYPYQEHELKKYKNIKKNKNQILFISQGNIGLGLSKIAYKFIEKSESYNVIYKLHPGEYDRWKKEYPWLIKAQKKGLKVIDNNQIDFYKLLAQSEFIVGVNSTGLFEGIMLDCKLILVNLFGVEYMKYLISNLKVPVIENGEHLLQILKNETPHTEVWGI